MMHHHHLTPLWTAVFTVLIVATFTPWGRLRNALRRLRGLPQRGPGPAHPSRRSQRIRLTDEQVRSRLEAITEAERQRDRGQR